MKILEASTSIWSSESSKHSCHIHNYFRAHHQSGITTLVNSLSTKSGKNGVSTLPSSPHPFQLRLPAKFFVCSEVGTWESGYIAIFPAWPSDCQRNSVGTGTRIPTKKQQKHLGKSGLGLQNHPHLPSGHLQQFGGPDIGGFTDSKDLHRRPIRWIWEGFEDVKRAPKWSEKQVKSG